MLPAPIVVRLAIVLAFACGLAAPAAGAAAVTLALSGNSVIELSAQPTRIALAPSAAPAADDGRRIFLVIDGLSADLPPATGYDVFLDLPENTRPRRDDPGYAGTLNFFGVSNGLGTDRDNSVAFEVTPVLARLRAAGRAEAARTVTLVPERPPYAGSKPAVGRVKLVAQ